jgi:hypothetical protein
MLSAGGDATATDRSNGNIQPDNAVEKWSLTGRELGCVGVFQLVYI